MPYDRPFRRTHTARTDRRDEQAWRYEHEKQAWIAANPGATPKQYDAAIRAICRRLGY